MLEHGGNLRDAVHNFGRPLEQWLDLSTGINPGFYPVPPLPPDAWHRLPEPSTALQEAAQAYYQAPQMLAVAGTQAAIQALPRLRAASHATSRIVVSAPSYAEHAHQWRQAGFSVSESPYALLGKQVDAADVIVICNPNNPTGERIAPAQLLDWAGRLAARGGWLIVDEAFADTANDFSIARYSQQAGVIVLRSVGKFFGLAGIRLGFVAAGKALLRQLAHALGPWAISGPAQQIALSALRDSAWQQQTRDKLQHDGERLRNLLRQHGWHSSGTDLFQWISHHETGEQSEHLFHFMAQRGIWLRWFAPGPQRPHGVRLGLPGGETGWQRLQQACHEWTQQQP